MLCDSCYPSYTLRYWGARGAGHDPGAGGVADERSARCPVGLADRGTIEVGKAADLVAFDPDTVGETHPNEPGTSPPKATVSSPTAKASSTSG